MYQTRRVDIWFSIFRPAGQLPLQGNVLSLGTGQRASFDTQCHDQNGNSCTARINASPELGEALGKARLSGLLVGLQS